MSSTDTKSSTDNLLALATGENPRIVARTLYWQGFSITAASDMVGVARTTVDGWKKTDGWDDARPIDRVEGTVEARMIQLIYRDDKSGKDFKEIDLLGRQMVNLAKVNKFEQSGKQSDLNSNLSNRGRTLGQKMPSNVFNEEDIAKLKESFHYSVFDYQKVWYQAGLVNRTRNLLKSRQIGATWYFAREALMDALTTGRNQIFLSASKSQARVFRSYICQWVMEVCGIELTGDPITLSVDYNGALMQPSMYFLGTNSRTAQSYHGNVYMDEYFWINKFAEFNKVASGMAMHKKWRKTYISTPSSKQHQAYPFWTGEKFNKGRRKENKINIDISHRALAKGLKCADSQWRQLVTVYDAIDGGCDLFDIDDLRLEYSDDEFENLLMCQFIDDTLSAFSVSEMQTCMMDAIEEWLDWKPYTPRPLGDQECWLGYDPSLSRDHAGLVVLAAPSTPGGVIRGIERIQFKEPDFEAQAEVIKQMIKKYNITYIAIDTTGLGIGVYQSVIKFYPTAVALHYNPELKQQMVIKTKDVIKKKRLKFDAGWTDIVASFVSIHKTITDSQKTITYKASRSEETGHADLAWAMMHAIHKEPLAIAQGETKSELEMY